VSFAAFLENFLDVNLADETVVSAVEVAVWASVVAEELVDKLLLVSLCVEVRQGRVLRHQALVDLLDRDVLFEVIDLAIDRFDH